MAQQTLKNIFAGFWLCMLLFSMGCGQSASSSGASGGSSTLENQEVASPNPSVPSRSLFFYVTDLKSPHIKGQDSHGNQMLAKIFELADSQQLCMLVDGNGNTLNSVHVGAFLYAIMDPELPEALVKVYCDGKEIPTTPHSGFLRNDPQPLDFIIPITIQNTPLTVFPNNQETQEFVIQSQPFLAVRYTNATGEIIFTLANPDPLGMFTIQDQVPYKADSYFGIMDNADFGQLTKYPKANFETLGMPPI